MCVCVCDAENGPLDLCVERTGWVYLLFYRLVGGFSVSVFVCDCWLAFEVVFTSVCVRACLYDFIGVTEQLSFLNECNYVINN